MNKRILVAAVFLLSLISTTRGETNGYFSFEYSRNLRNADIKTDTFQDVQLGLIFSGSLSSSIVYVAELRLGEGQIQPEQAWLSFFSSESFRLKVGLFLVPFGKYNVFSRPHETFLIHAPLNIAHTFPPRWRDIGILLEGRIGTLGYAIFAGNGLSEGVDMSLGQQFVDNNRNKGIGTRLSWILSESFEVAYSHYRGKVDADNQRNAVKQCVDVTWSTEGFKLLGEYTRGDIENPNDLSKGKSDGYFIQISLPWQKIHPVVSYQKLNYTDIFHGPGFGGSDIPGTGIQLNQNRWTFGVVFMPLPNVLFKVEYDLNKDGGLDKKKTALTLQAALSF